MNGVGQAEEGIEMPVKRGEISRGCMVRRMVVKLG